ncbi:MAG: polymer-forming cytoskeletal protein [bacterium]|nr:polymer-forming cytoskeletal protein [bacterium]
MAKWTRLTSSDSFSGEMSTLLAKDAEIHGTLRTQGSLRIDGRVVGDLFVGKSVTTGNSGSVEGNIQAESIVLAGRVKGSLVAKEKIHLEATAELDGNLSATRLSITEGARVRGHAATDEVRVPSAKPAIADVTDVESGSLVPRNRPATVD